MVKSIVTDTNLLLDDPEILFKLNNDYDRIVLPLTVVKELDKHKHNKDLAYSARSAIYNIIQFQNQFPNKIHYENGDMDGSTNDLKIINAASSTKSVIATKDLSMSVMAAAKHVDTILYNIVEDRLHTSIFFVEYNDLPDDMKYIDIYENKEYTTFIDVMSKVCAGFDCTDMCYIIITSTSDVIYAHNPRKKRVERIDNKPRYRELRVDKDVGIKAKDNYQICAIYALHNSDNVLLTGKWGSGKTLLATAYALQAIKEGKKIFITRPPTGIDKKYDIGALPGSKNDKMIEWCSGIISAMYYLYSNTRAQEFDGVSFDYVKEELFYKKFEIIPINAIQGLSLLKDDILIVDECQLVSVDYFSMILSRASSGSKVLLVGDYKQTYDIVRPSESGLLKLCRLLPHKAMAHVDLKTSFRGEVTELADLLSSKDT